MYNLITFNLSLNECSCSRYRAFHNDDRPHLLCTKRGYVYVLSRIHFILPSCSLLSSLIFLNIITGVQRNAKALPGRMLYANGSTMHLAGPPNNVIGKEGYADIIELQTLV